MLILVVLDLERKFTSAGETCGMGEIFFELSHVDRDKVKLDLEPEKIDSPFV